MSRLSWGEMLRSPSLQEEGVAGGKWGGSSHLDPAQPPGSEDHTDMSFSIVLCELCRQMQSADVPLCLLGGPSRWTLLDKQPDLF